MSVLIVMKAILIGASACYLAGTVKYFLAQGYGLAACLLQAGLHLLFCTYLLFGWINLLGNTPGLDVTTLTVVGFLWVVSSYALYVIVGYLQGSIPRNEPDESAM